MRALFSRRSALALAIAGILGIASPTRAADDIVVFAAASLKNALDDAVRRYEETTGRTVLVSYAGTSTLAKQIEQGALADIFFSADQAWMDYVAERDLIRPETRHTLLGNSIVLIAPESSGAAVAVGPAMDLPALLGADGRLAMADTEAVPAGRYGKAALQSLGLWDGVADRIVQTDSVRTALAFVARGEAPLGIVYATDAAAEPAVRVLGAFLDDSHPPILYPVAVTASSANPDAAAFVDFLRSDAARPAFEGQGFTVPAVGS